MKFSMKDKNMALVIRKLQHFILDAHKKLEKQDRPLGKEKGEIT